MPRTPSPIAALAAFLVLLVVACSGGAGLEEYYADLEGLTAKLDDELDAVEAGFNAGLLEIDFESAGAEDQLIDLFRTSITATVSSFSTLVRGLESLAPPSEIEEIHGEAVAAGQRVLGAYEERADELAAISVLSDIDAYALSLAESGVRARFSEACRELQIYADEAEVRADLGCRTDPAS